ncbi:MAG TPA: BPSS1780 family membrane protein [Casimicrobiaceae bacterium]|nr:BPSS1780 family membrane protein [Casimicrobiaceae bacterium]
MSNQPTTGPAASAAPAPRAVNADRGFAWWGEAWRLFTPAAGIWILIIILLIIVNMVLAVIPLIGHVVGQLLFPVFAGGLMLGCRAVDRGGPLTVGHLFAGFGQRTGPLFIVGLIYTAVAVGIALVVFGLLLMFFGAAIVSSLWHLQDLQELQDPWAVASMLGNLGLAILVGLLVFLMLYLPLVMAVWFAPALVVLRGVEPLEAMRLSFNGCLRNIVPFLLYGLVGIGLSIVATIPLLLGWLVLAPVTIASLYTSYCDIYEDQVSVPAVVATPVV